MTLQYDALPREWLDRAVAWMTERGAHPYAVLEDWELPRFRGIFDGQATLERLDVPILRHRNVFVYDLAPLPGRVLDTQVIPLEDADLACRLPAPRPALDWR